MAIKVDGEPIPDSAIEFEFNRLLKFYSEYFPPSKIKEIAKDLRKKAVDQAIGTKLLMKQVELLDIKVDPADVEKRFNDLVEKAGGRDAFEKLLKSQRITADYVKEGIEKGRKLDLLVEKITSEASEPTEEEILAYFESNKDEFIKPKRAQAQHILIKTGSGSVEEEENARRKIEGIRKDILSGMDFSHAAAAHSDCPSGRKTGGSLGWIVQGTMVPEFDSAVFCMEVGQISEIVKTSLGFHLIKKTAEEPEGPAEFTDVRDKIRDFLRHAHKGAALSAYVNELKSRSVIEGV